MEEEKVDPGHAGLRSVFRTLGPVLLVIGVLFIIVAMVDFFTAFGSRHPPRNFWCFFVGMPLLAIGGVITKLGYMGKIARYLSKEISPVAKDVFNYAANGTKDGVKTVASAIGEGLAAGGLGREGTKVRCHKCNNLVEEGAKFCSRCGTALAKTRPCPTCSELNDPDAKFCDNCGYRFP